MNCFNDCTARLRPAESQLRGPVGEHGEMREGFVYVLVAAWRTAPGCSPVDPGKKLLLPQPKPEEWLQIPTQRP